MVHTAYAGQDVAVDRKPTIRIGTTLQRTRDRHSLKWSLSLTKKHFIAQSLLFNCVGGRRALTDQPTLGPKEPNPDTSSHVLAFPTKTPVSLFFLSFTHSLSFNIAFLFFTLIVFLIFLTWTFWALAFATELQQASFSS